MGSIVSIGLSDNILEQKKQNRVGLYPKEIITTKCTRNVKCNVAKSIILVFVSGSIVETDCIFFELIKMHAFNLNCILTLV